MVEDFDRDNYSDDGYNYETVRNEVPMSWWTPRRIVSSVVGVSVASMIFAFTVFIYNSPQDSLLWGLQQRLFSDHADQVAIRTVAAELKQAQNMLNSDPVDANQLTEARSLLNASKTHLDDVSSISPKSALQSLYLQLTQSILQKTPAQVLALPPLPGDPAADPSIVAQFPPPAWSASGSGTNATVLGEPDPRWPAPMPAPETPTIAAINSGADIAATISDAALSNSITGSERITRDAWNDFGLSGYNRYGYDVLGYDRWGYDLSGYDRWGYNKDGYNWYGYNLAGYDRNGWDRDGINIWGQRRGHPDDPTRQDWYDQHQPFQEFYKQKFANDNPTFSRSLWYRDRGFEPARFRDWNANSEWSTPFDRDWARVNKHVQQSASNLNPAAEDRPVVDLSVSLEQFVELNTQDNGNHDVLAKLSSTSAEDFARQITRTERAQAKASASRQPDHSQTTEASAAPAPPQEARTKNRIPMLGATPPAPLPSLVSKDFKMPTRTKRSTSSTESTTEKSNEGTTSSTRETPTTETPTTKTTQQPEPTTTTRTRETTSPTRETPTTETPTTKTTQQPEPTTTTRTRETTSPTRETPTTETPTTKTTHRSSSP
ncbi:hypothetical protein [Mycobacteroides abscessus]|uniref:hypothetical protein n=1 Tax=Mycobacteroides abscessus TaxID=36809 RepID=UPI002104B37B|nr:hypothetical protein [Mycobacteroides abscessus]